MFKPFAQKHYYVRMVRSNISRVLKVYAKTFIECQKKFQRKNEKQWQFIKVEYLGLFHNPAPCVSIPSDSSIGVRSDWEKDEQQVERLLVLWMEQPKPLMEQVQPEPVHTQCECEYDFAELTFI